MDGNIIINHPTPLLLLQEFTFKNIRTKWILKVHQKYIAKSTCIFKILFSNLLLQCGVWKLMHNSEELFCLWSFK
jgi:hypothetical protein